MWNPRNNGLEFIEAVRDGVGRRLAGDGWSEIEPRRAMPFGVGAFILPLADGFAALALFPRLSNDVEGVVVGRLGVIYEPAAHLLQAFAGSRVSGVILNDPVTSVAILGSPDVSNAVDGLVGFVREDAVVLARRHADVHVMIERLGKDLAVPFTGDADPMYAAQALHGNSTLPLDDVEAELVPALLATAGYREEASQALEMYASRNVETATNRRGRRVARQLTRWLDAGGELGLPSSPPEWPLLDELRPTRGPDLAQAIASGIADSRARTEMTDAMRAEGAGKTRLMLRGLRELWEHGGARGPGIQEIFNHEVDPEVDPSWLTPPDRAAYPVRSIDPRWIAVDLRPDARALLARIMQLDRKRHGRHRPVEAWLAWEEDPAGDPRLTVYSPNSRKPTKSLPRSTRALLRCRVPAR